MEIFFNGQIEERSDKDFDKRNPKFGRVDRVLQEKKIEKKILVLNKRMLKIFKK